MIAVMICNAVIKSVYALCVTAAAIYFHNSWILWWYMVLPFLGYEYKQTPIEKGGADDGGKQ